MTRYKINFKSRGAGDNRYFLNCIVSLKRMFLSRNRKLMCTYWSTTVLLASFNAMNGGTGAKERRPSSDRIIEDVDRVFETL